MNNSKTTKQDLINTHNEILQNQKWERIEAKIMKVFIAIVVSYAIIQGVIYFTR